MESRKINNFTDLVVWKEGHKLVLLVYSISKAFPKEEAFGLTSQIRRCAVSITSNVAEGFSRHSYKEKIQFYCVAQGSLTELQNQLIIARDVKYISRVDFDALLEQATFVSKILSGLIKKSKTLF
jgi:four helix bundle protein